MNLGVEEQAQRRKKDKKRSRKKKDGQSQQQKHQEPIRANHKKIFKTKIIKIPQRKIGLIIGQNGKNIKELYQLTHCDIILPKQIKKKNEFEDLNEFDDRDYYYVYDAYNDTVQTNINQNDDDNKNNKNDNNNNEEDKEEDDINDPNRLVEVKLRGTPEEIRDAEVELNFMVKHGRLMLDHERSGKPKRETENDDIFYGDKEIAEDIRIPSKICGMLIGSGGQRVKELMEETGCEIWVDWDKESHIEAGVSTVHLKGTRYSVDFAKEEIRRIQKLFEKGSTNFKFEIPAFCSKDLYGENGQNLKQLQKQYNVTINVKNYRNERRTLRIGDEEQRIQRTLMIILIGEHQDQIACKKGIEKLVGFFVKCQQCMDLKREDDGYQDNYSGNWYCNSCWDEFNGVEKDKDNQNNNNYNNNNNNNNQQQRQQHRQPQRQQQRRQPPQRQQQQQQRDDALSHGMRQLNVNDNQYRHNQQQQQRYNNNNNNYNNNYNYNNNDHQQQQHYQQPHGIYDDGVYDNYNRPQQNQQRRKNKW